MTQTSTPARSAITVTYCRVGNSPRVHRAGKLTDGTLNTTCGARSRNGIVEVLGLGAATCPTCAREDRWAAYLESLGTAQPTTAGFSEYLLAQYDALMADTSLYPGTPEYSAACDTMNGISQQLQYLAAQLER